MANGETIESYVPARLDRMPWSRWHWLIVISLGVIWVLDGLEVTLAGSLGGILTRRETLGLTDIEVGATASCYLAGAVIGAPLEPLFMTRQSLGELPWQSRERQPVAPVSPQHIAARAAAPRGDVSTANCWPGARTFTVE